LSKQREKARGVASVFHAHIRERYDTEHARFTVLDLPDKMLWEGNGNAIIFGLAMPQHWDGGVAGGTR
jgi:hypothetical protein